MRAEIEIGIERFLYFRGQVWYNGESACLVDPSTDAVFISIAT